ncbi:hypothetical protein A5661_23395 [Mycobacterium asiaticum]|nr:hypothetical protein A5661_23395 [Mycobacterium asiaticum]
MFRGPGSEPLLAAAAAWDALGRALYSAEISLISVVSGLGSGVWLGPSATSMAEAIRPHLKWIGTASIRAHHTAAQARSAVAAYETALRATVVPTQIVENRARLRSLAAANRLAQYTPAIAAVEARYCEMWAQDAQAMYRYASDAAMATRLVPFPVPDIGLDPAAPGEQGDSPTLTQADAQLYHAVPHALNRLAAPTVPPGTPQSAVDLVDNPADSEDSGMTSSMSAVSTLVSTRAKPDTGRRGAIGRPLSASVQAWFSGCRRPGTKGSQAGPAARPDVGPAALIGELSVPQAWVDRAPPRPAPILPTLADPIQPRPVSKPLNPRPGNPAQPTGDAPTSIPLDSLGGTTRP